VSALFVEDNGVYFDVPSVDPWAAPSRDACEYDGPNPVVAHPPCARWCKLAGLVEHVYGYKRGDDGGTFRSALDSVRKWGGVLEHPAYSAAWLAYGLNAPPSDGGWVNADFLGGWTCHVEQHSYGHKARKATWIYVHGCNLPSMAWGSAKIGSIDVAVSYANSNIYQRKRMSKANSSRTPLSFRDQLIRISRDRN
jgi:hypothetical protein